jgi:hypothetical protein
MADDIVAILREILDELRSTGPDWEGQERTHRLLEKIHEELVDLNREIGEVQRLLSS